jgi:hypothetical protein
MSTPRAGLFTPGKAIRFPFDRRLVGSLWMCLDSHASTEFRTPDRPARSELYELFSPGRLSPAVILLFILPSTHVDHLVGKQEALFPVDTLLPHIQDLMGTLFPRYKQVYSEGHITFSTTRKIEWDYVTTNCHIPSWCVQGQMWLPC